MIHLHTDIGHDPDDVIALCYLIENNYTPTSVSVSPGYYRQVDILYSIFNYYNLRLPKFYISKECDNTKYVDGPHKILKNDKTVGFKLLDKPIECDKALIIGPAKNLGLRLIASTFTFQGGYSPNSIKPLEKFAGQKSVQSFNPSGARDDFKLLLNSQDIKTKYYVGKNICHGFCKSDLRWAPSPKILREFFNNLSSSKAMHDVLAAKMFIDPTIGVWEKAKPVFNGLKMSTEITEEEIYTLIGIK